MRNKGSALIDYIIPTALVGIVVGLGLYTMSSSNNILNFFAASMNLSVDTETGMAINKVENSSGFNSATPEAGSLGGTPENPAKECIGSSCTIDYGNFILTGIPEDFKEFIEVNSTSGGTSKLYSIIGQIADQLEKDGDSTGAQEFRDLANLGHFASDLERMIENQAKTCSTAEYAGDCMQEFLHKTDFVKLPDNISHLLTEFDNTNSLLSLQGLTDIGQARNEKINNPDSFNEDSNTNTGNKMIEIFDSIQNNDKYSDAMKKVTSKLIKEISNLNFNFKGEIQAIDAGFVLENVPFDQYDPITGEYLGEAIFEMSNGIDDVLEPDTSKVVDLNSTLICLTGNESCK